MPLRRVELEAEDGLLITLGEMIDCVERDVAQQICQVATARDRFVTLPQMVLPACVPVSLLIGNAR